MNEGAGGAEAAKPLFYYCVKNLALDNLVLQSCSEVGAQRHSLYTTGSDAAAGLRIRSERMKNAAAISVLPDELQDAVLQRLNIA